MYIEKNLDFGSTVRALIKLGHLLSEFAIEFASELCCRILLSKVTNKVSESRC